MFETDLDFDEDYIKGVQSGLFLPTEGYKLSEDRTSIIRKTEEEILAADWNDSIERRCEYRDYLEWSIHKMEEFLLETDWYVSRKAETGKEIPGDVAATRNEYREKISNFRNRLKGIPDEGDFEDGTDSSIIS